jgi:hypothetical protein
MANGADRRPTDQTYVESDFKGMISKEEIEDEKLASSEDVLDIEKRDSLLKEPKTLVSFLGEAKLWAQETFPTVMAVLSHLPFALIPFALSMFVLVQALVTKGWVPVFAYGWDRWVKKTGTVGAVGGMGFLAVILCNVSK